MIDTTEKYAIQLSIQEFNDWCPIGSNPKYTLAELKGIFFNKLMKNLKGTTVIGPNYWDAKKYTTQLIETFEVIENKITKLKFIEPVVGHNPELRQNMIRFNNIVSQLDLKVTMGILPNFADKINQFKIK